MAFVGDGEYPLAMQRVCRLLESYVLEERVDGSQARIPRASAVLASAFQVLEEKTKKGCVEIFDQDFRRYFAKPLFCKMQKQAEAIAISRYGVRARSPLVKQAISKERLKERGKLGGDHGCVSRSINRSVAS